MVNPPAPPLDLSPFCGDVLYTLGKMVGPAGIAANILALMNAVLFRRGTHICSDYRPGFHPDPTKRLPVARFPGGRLNTKLSKSVPFGVRSRFEAVLAVGRYPSLTRL